MSNEKRQKYIFVSGLVNLVVRISDGFLVNPAELPQFMEKYDLHPDICSISAIFPPGPWDDFKS